MVHFAARGLTGREQAAPQPGPQAGRVGGSRRCTRTGRGAISGARAAAAAIGTGVRITLDAGAGTGGGGALARLAEAATCDSRNLMRRYCSVRIGAVRRARARGGRGVFPVVHAADAGAIVAARRWLQLGDHLANQLRVDDVFVFAVAEQQHGIGDDVDFAGQAVAGLANQVGHLARKDARHADRRLLQPMIDVGRRFPGIERPQVIPAP